MILGTRSAVTSTFTGVNVILLRDWILPIDGLGGAAFRVFDETLQKLRSDKDATRIVPIKSEDAAASELNTATEAAKRSLPEKHRLSTDLYTLALTPDREMKRKALWTNLPAWARIHVEDKHGDLFRFDRTGEKPGEWFMIPVQEEDLFVHLSFFSDEWSVKLSSGGQPNFERLSRMIEESSRPAHVRTLQIPIHPADLL